MGIPPDAFPSLERLQRSSAYHCARVRATSEEVSGIPGGPALALIRDDEYRVDGIILVAGRDDGEQGREFIEAIAQGLRALLDSYAPAAGQVHSWRKSWTPE